MYHHLRSLLAEKKKRFLIPTRKNICYAHRVVARSFAMINFGARVYAPEDVSERCLKKLVSTKTFSPQLEPLSTQLEDRVLRRLSMVLTHDRKLPLTSTRASLDRMASTSSSGGTEDAALDEQNNSEGEVEGSATCDDSDSNTSVTSSASYRLLLFLRRLIRTLSGQNLDKT